MAGSNTDGVVKTQRAYTLRLRAGDENDRSWTDALWTTHSAVNRGAHAFGDWLLTLRGGLCHTLEDAEVQSGDQPSGTPAAKKPTTRTPAPENSAAERRRRRVLLALSWLSVESAPENGDTHKHLVVASGKKDCQSTRNEKVVAALRSILKGRGLKDPEIGQWVADCEPSLSAAIRDDAVWVNRSAAFDAACQRVGDSLTREGAWDLLECFFGGPDAYLASSKGTDKSETGGGSEDKAKDLVQGAGQWLSSRFGTGNGASFSDMSKVYTEIGKWAAKAQGFSAGHEALVSLAESLSQAGFHPPSKDADGIIKLVSGPGYKSKTRNTIKAWESKIGRVEAEELKKFTEIAQDDARKCDEKAGRKGRRPWSDAVLKDVEAACGFTYLQRGGASRHREFAVMLDHAARRVSAGHSWIKRAEADRQKFEGDAAKMGDVPAPAREWLDKFCNSRSISTNALGGYRIRKRALGGWEQVAARWCRSSCETADDRVAAAREAQADPEIEKFGDIQLFEALAVEDARCVWCVNDSEPAKTLIDYVAAADAMAKQCRFKVPAYRHPDPLTHPVFCDFGESRWHIKFAAHAAAARSKLERRKAEERLEKANAGQEQPDAAEQPGQVHENLAQVGADYAGLSSAHGIEMKLWDGQTLRICRVRWSSKRLTEDMALRSNAIDAAATPAARADRLGRAAAGARPEGPVNILNVFSEKHWGGRLQAPRAQLDALARHIAKYGCDEKAMRMRRQIHWSVSFSAKLQPVGPWIKYAATFSDGAPAKPFVSRSGECAVRHGDNDSRGGHAKLILSRLAGLRVLSVDLGHRYAAACAVWETLSADQMNSACRAANHRGPAESDLFLHIGTTDAEGKKRTTIYRRIGADKVADGKEHPAPWARLDRQFLIKLPGEERPPRAASNERAASEIQRAEAFAERLGLAVSDAPYHGRAVDDLMLRAVRLASLALKRHARRAKIAYAMDPNTKAFPGVGNSARAFDTGDNEHIKFLTGALVDWHALASESKLDDQPARELWNQYVAMAANGWRIEGPIKADESADRPSRQQRQKEDEALRGRLTPVAEKLAAVDRSGIHAAWKTRWETDDGQAAGVDRATGRKTADGSGLHADLRWLTDWIMGRKLPGAAGNGWRYNVGGLSVTRIATMRSLYQLHKAFAMRARPDAPSGAPEEGETNAGVAQSILDAHERLREQRVKQLASRIVEAALGIGRVERKHVAAGAARPRGQVDKPCHAVVIENLTNYRPDELQTRRENRQLMAWSSGKVKKYLSDACQLHGLCLREVQPSYTSRQDSRTGSPGVRCADVPVDEFMDAPWWRKQVSDAKKKKAKENGGSARDRYLLDLDGWCTEIPQTDRRKEHRLRIPKAGGELFVSAHPHSPAAKGIQADLNAAANIGLKALLDPDWPGRWWYVPCSCESLKPHAEKTKGSAAFHPDAPLSTPTDAPVRPDPQPGRGRSASTKGNKKKRDVVNLWRDATNLKTNETQRQWRHSMEYWNGVQDRVIELLKHQRVAADRAASAGGREEDIAPEDAPW